MTLHLIPTRFGEELRNPEFNKVSEHQSAVNMIFFVFFFPVWLSSVMTPGSKVKRGNGCRLSIVLIQIPVRFLVITQQLMETD